MQPQIKVDERGWEVDRGDVKKREPPMDADARITAETRRRGEEGPRMDTDAECLQRAQNIRVVLSSLAENIGHALRDQQELKEALSGLMSQGGKKTKKTQETQQKQSRQREVPIGVHRRLSAVSFSPCLGVLVVSFPSAFIGGFRKP